MRKILVLVLSFLLLSAAVVQAKARPEIPERNGVYNDPDNKGVKVRVFVHQAKPSPSPTPPPAPVCSLADNNSSNAPVGETGWQLPANWQYRLNPDSAPAAFRASLPVIAARSFAVWQGAVNNAVNFATGSATTVNRQAYDGQNVIAWGRTSGSALAVTYTRFLTASGAVVDVDTIMNNKFKWGWTDQEATAFCAAPDVYDAQNILTHELGHWLGLDDEYTGDYTEHTMYGYGSKTEVKKNTLTSGDINSALTIY